MEYGRYNKTRLTDKIAMISTTTGSPEDSYTPNGFTGDILWTNTISYQPWHALIHRYNITRILHSLYVSHGQNDREFYIESYKKRLQNIDKIKHIENPKLVEFNANGQLD